MVTIVCKTSVTDHSCIYFMVPPGQQHQIMTKKRKIMHKLDYNTVTNLLQQADWSNVLASNDPNKATEMFLAILSDIIKSSTMSFLVPNRRQTYQPWITPGLLRCMRFRDTLHNRHLKSPHDKDLEITYKRYRNHCNNILHNLKNAHDKLDLHNNRNDIKNTWNVIKRVCNLKKSSKSQELCELLSSASTPQDSVNNANSFFANIGSDLSNKILKRLKLEEKDLIKRFECKSAPINSFFMSETDESEVYRLVLSLKSKNSSGWDGISSIFVKKFIGFLVKPLTYIFNLCIITGIFSKVLKSSVVVPVFKSGERNSVHNYRPISLLPTIAKILEKIINVKLVNYIEKNNILSQNQFGFRKNKSTEDAIESLVTSVAKNLDNKNKCLAIFLDLAKAFDTVSIPLLICKLESIGIRGVQLDLFKSYLSNRSQAVKIGEYLSSNVDVSFGVPQGSVLGPTLFLIYINSLCEIDIPQVKIITFADDTVLVFQHTSWSSVKKIAEKGLREVSKWLDFNLLTLNIKKTKYITFSIRKNLQPDQNFALKAHSLDCDNFNICQCPFLTSTNSIKYLGIEIDNNLNWQQHLSNLKTKIRKLTPIFKRIRNLKDDKTNKMLYFTLCQSITSYGISAWGAARKCALLKIERAQRLIIKVINFKPYRYPTTKLYKEFGVLSVRQLFIKSIVLRQHSCMKRSNTSARRTYEVYDVPSCKTSFAQCFSYYLAPMLYNRLCKIKPLKDLSRHVCKKTLDEILRNLDYEQTELIIKVCK